MVGIITDLNVAGRLAVRAVKRRLRHEVDRPPDLDAFTRAMERVLSQAPKSVVRDYHWVKLPANQPPWTATGVRLEAGEECSYFAEGRAYANRFLDIYVTPALQLWSRVGEHGNIFRGTRNSHSFRAQENGELRFGNYFPNDWVDAHGARKQDDRVYRTMSGEMKVLVIRWTAGALDGLRALTADPEVGARVRAEIERIEHGETTPAGWHYLWHLGPAEIYRTPKPGADPCIHCRTHADAGILQKDVELSLDESTAISWRWRIDRLPSTLREDSVPSHDYLSLAVEFDNGRDITYYWSSELPVGTGYDCPLPNWKGKEFHVVVRSGPQGLGEWQAEQRNLYLDYRRYMGDPPARIVRVWLIANSVFQRGEGACDYAGITLHQRAGDVAVL